MNCSQAWFKVAAVTMAVVMAMISIPGSLARAELISTEEVVDRTTGTDRARILQFVGRDDVRQHMIRLGVDPDEAAARVRALSDAEVTRIAGAMDAEPAGQHPAAVVIGVAAFVFVVLLITDILGYTDIFPFVKKKPKR